MTLTRIHSGLLVTGVIAVALFCVAGLSVADEPKVFSHALHLEAGVGCTDCHNAEEGASLVPPPEACAQCHEGSLMPVKLNTQARRLIFTFPHPQHAAAFDCVRCHEATSTDTAQPGKPVLTQPDCVACHAENGVELPANKCATCHGSNVLKTPPADHSKLWLKKHGKEATWRVHDDHGKDCSLCHKSNTCKSCHLKSKPENHTGLWIRRLHGKAATWDQDTCKTCHESGSCVRCHRTNTPSNHTGNWRFIHGRVGSNQESCGVCHKTYDPSCLSCHGQGK
jgi:cytochrome c553